MLIKDGKDLIAQLLVESRCLKTERAEHHMVTATGTGFLFCGMEQFRADALTSQVLMHPDRLDVTTATPGPTFETRLDGLLVITEKNGQPLSIIHASRSEDGSPSCGSFLPCPGPNDWSMIRCIRGEDKHTSPILIDR